MPRAEHTGTPLQEVLLSGGVLDDSVATRPAGSEPPPVSEPPDSDSSAQTLLFPEQKKIGEWLSNAEGGPSKWCYAGYGLCALTGLVGLLALPACSRSQFPGSKPLLYVTGLLAGLACTALGLAVYSARVALCAGGKLHELRAGEVTVSEEDTAFNARWRNVLLALSTLSVLPFGVFFIASGVLELRPLFVPGSAPTIYRTFVVLGGLVFCTVVPTIYSGWWASMRTASCLCRAAAIEAKENAKITSPKDEEEWEAKVNQKALALPKKFELLSDGWSFGLLGMGSAAWLVALAQFTLAINVPLMKQEDTYQGFHPGTGRAVWLAFMVIFASLPFPLAYDIAGTSTSCDELMDTLNKARIKHGKECHLTIQCLETALKQLVRRPSLRASPFPLRRLKHARVFGTEREPRPRLRHRRHRHRQA